MSRTLSYLGLLLLVGAAWGLLAEETQWAGAAAATWAPLGIRAGLACLVGGMALRLLAPVSRSLRQGACARCGASIDRGQTYCLDHLQATLNEYRDRTREGMMRRPGAR